MDQHTVAGIFAIEFLMNVGCHSWNLACNQILGAEDVKFAENCDIVNCVNPQNKNNCFENLNMNKTFKQSKSQTDVFFCIPQIELLQHQKTKLHLVEYLTNFPNFISAVVLDENQYDRFEAVHKKNNFL